MNSYSGLILALVVYRPVAPWRVPRTEKDASTVWETWILFPGLINTETRRLLMSCEQADGMLRVKWCDRFLRMREPARDSGPLKPGHEMLHQVCDIWYEPGGYSKPVNCLFDMKVCASFEEASAWIKARIAGSGKNK